MYRLPLKKILITFFLIIQVLPIISANRIDYNEMDLDNPWLCLTAIKNSYPDIASDIFFDEKENDWCITIRNVNFYWAHGRLVQKRNLNRWYKWHPFISYYYETTPPHPRYYTKELINSLKPKNLIAARKAAAFPNYSFYKVVYQGNSRKQIIKQLRAIRFLNKTIWVHKRIVAPLKRVERKIYQASRYDKATRYFLKTKGDCWAFNWRVIADSGKLSNHSWGTAVDILPKHQGRKKIYWYWEAKKNSRWMLIPPNRRWSPPYRVIQAFQSEGFIWGGNWYVWDTMHFEYRPELIYISEFIGSQKARKFVKRKIPNKIKPVEKNTTKDFKPNSKFSSIFQIAEQLSYIQTLTKNYQQKNTEEINFFKKELKAEQRALKEHNKTKDDMAVPESRPDTNNNEQITEDEND